MELLIKEKNQNSIHMREMESLWNKVRNIERTRALEKTLVLKKSNKKHEHDKGVNRLEFNKGFENYLLDVEKITGMEISKEQKDLIKNAIENNDFHKLNSDDNKKHREEYNAVKNEEVLEWEKHMGRKWPTYDKPVLSKRGKVVRKVGQRYDIHHIIENSFNGPNKWWNFHPATHPDQHQWKIHRPGGPADGLFGR